MTSLHTFLFISPGEIGLILFVVLLVFGADKVPEIARGLGRAIRQVRDETNDIESEIIISAEDYSVEMDISKDVNIEIDAVKTEVVDITDHVNRNLTQRHVLND